MMLTKHPKGYKISEVQIQINLVVLSVKAVWKRIRRRKTKKAKSQK